MSVRVILFESPLWLLAILAGVEFVLLHVWTRRRTRLTARLAVGGLIAIPLCLGAQFLIVTDQERLRDVCRELARATGAADVPAFARHVADDFLVERDGRRIGKKELLRELEEILLTWDVQEERLSDFTYEVTAGEAVVEFQAACRVVSNEMLIPYHVSRWRLRFRRYGDTWLVTHIEPLSMGRGYGSVVDVLR